MRMTRNKQMILNVLAAAPDDEYLAAAAVAERLDKRMSDVARTLRLMDEQGLVVSKLRDVPVERPGIGFYTRSLKCYQRADVT